MLVAVDAMDFHFESTCTTPYMSAPSSPRRFGHGGGGGGGDYYFSAPTSPARASAIYQEFNSSSTQRFNWDESIENPKSRDTHDEEDDEDADFAFDFGVQLDKTSLSADELFYGGKIKPLLQPQTQTTNRFSQIDYDEFNKSRNRKSPISSPRSPTHQQGKKIHPFSNKPQMRGEEQDRGRGRTMTSSSSKSNRRESRSLSPLRIAEFAWEEEQHQLQQQSSKPISSSSTATDGGAVIGSSGSLKGSKKWSFKDLLLFRSASEGRASDKDPLRKYTAAAAAAAMATTKKSSTNEGGDEKNGSSFRSTDNNPGSRKKGPVSAHELHYKVNRAVSEESRRKTYLPYKPRLFGFLGFNPTVHSQRF